MEISAFLIKILLLFFPGFIAKIVIDQLITLEKKKAIYFFIYSFILGLFSYFAYAIVLAIIWGLGYLVFGLGLQVNLPVYKVIFFEALLNKETKISFVEIGAVSLIAVLVGIFWGAVINKKWFHNLLQKRWKITRKHPEVSIWEFVHSSPELGNWIYLRDLKADLIYEGWVSDFSDTVDDCELLIRDVKVYTLEEAEPVSNSDIDTPALYISRRRDQISVEFTDANEINGE